VVLDGSDAVVNDNPDVPALVCTRNEYISSAVICLEKLVDRVTVAVPVVVKLALLSADGFKQ
jgi:hypothetical protein